MRRAGAKGFDPNGFPIRAPPVKVAAGAAGDFTMKRVLILALAAAALVLGACQSMYVGGSVGTLADNGHAAKSTSGAGQTN